MQVKFIPAATPELWTQAPGFVGMCEHIARCAAVCYDSTPKTGGAAVDFVKNLQKRGHGRALEFGTVRMILDAWEYPEETLSVFYNSPYAKASLISGALFVTTNLRYLLELTAKLNAGDPLTMIADAWGKEVENVEITDGNSRHFAPRPTIHFPALSRAIADEFRTHTTLSTLMRSTRYTGAGRSEATAILPSWCNEDDPNYIAEGAFMAAVEDVYDAYERLIDVYGCRKEQARDVLPLCAATEMVQCGFVPSWQNLVRLRTDKAAHPDAMALAKGVAPIISEFAS